MRKRRKEARKLSPKALKIAFGLAVGIFVLIGIMYAGKRLLEVFTPQQQVFASPYTMQNQFIGIDVRLQKIGYQITDSKLSADKMVLHLTLKDGLEIILSNDYPIDWQLASLQRIISTLTIENKQPKLVDFRFDKPVVKF
jgi:hypothetical protein